MDSDSGQLRLKLQAERDTVEKLEEKVKLFISFVVGCIAVISFVNIVLL